MAIIAAMPRVSSPVFVGRTAELDRLCRALDEAGERRPTVRLVAGEAGIGKTRLVAEFAGRARESGAHILVGGCLQVGGTGLPYAPFVAALRPLLRGVGEDRLGELVGQDRRELARLLPDLGPSERQGEASQTDGQLSGTAAQARLFEIVLGLLRRLSDDATVLLVIEDLHWADASTRDLLSFLMRSIHDSRFTCVATYRSDELHRRHALRPLLAELQRLQNVDDIELGGFGKAELAEQIAGITGEQPDAGIKQIERAHPFDDLERCRRRCEQRGEPDRRGDRVNDASCRDAEHCGGAFAEPAGNAAGGDVRHVRPRRHVEQQSGHDEKAEVVNAGHRGYPGISS